MSLPSPECSSSAATARSNEVRSESAEREAERETLSPPPEALPPDSRKQKQAFADRPMVPAGLGGGEYAPEMVIAQKYRLVRVLCQGGMGSVWVAHNELLDVLVALKLIRHDLRTPGLAERLMTEARLAARLEHPAVVSVHDVGNTDRGDPYIVMELLKGEDLRELLERERSLEPARAVQCLLPILEGLSAAHARGIVHRDLKPENIYFTRIDERIQPKIVDFGIAKPTDGEQQRTVTRAGAVVGSPDYMAPEQARGLDDVDHRADIWAFAVVLYECLTGRPPFADSPYESLLSDIVDKPVVPTTERGVDEPELWEIIARGLAKAREDRFQSTREMGAALAYWLRARGVEEDVCGQSLRATWLRDSDPPRDAMGSNPVLLVPRSPRPGWTPGSASLAASFANAPTAESEREPALVAGPQAACGPSLRTPVPTPVCATLPSPLWNLGEAPAASEPPRHRLTRKVVGGIAIASAFALFGIMGTLITAVGTASASAPSELLAWSLADVAPRARWAAEELAVDDVIARSASAQADGKSVADMQTPPAPRGASSAQRPYAVFGAARSYKAEQSTSPGTTPPGATPAPARTTPRNWTSFAERDLGF